MTIRPGMYVRVPLLVEAGDQAHPRMFALAKVVTVDDMTQTVQVRYYDLYKSMSYYRDFITQARFRWDELIRSKPPVNALVDTPDGKGFLRKVRAADVEGFYSYLVEIPCVGIKFYREDAVKAEYSMPDNDPAEMLKRYEFQHPSWFASRCIVSSTMHMLENTLYGFKILAGCRVYLLPHQVLTVSRCLETSPVRSLLADEVGLGKTIEACSIIKIMEQRNPRLKVLYIIPKSLIAQWNFELGNKFGIRAVDFNQEQENDRHIIAPLEKLLSMEKAIQIAGMFDMVVVDEVHRVLSDVAAYRNLRTLCEHVTNVLLLSATPISDRKAEYHRLLTLLNPRRYGSMDLNNFSGLVEKQKNIQQRIYFILSDMEQYEDFAEDVKDALQSIAHDLQDDKLVTMVDQINLSSQDTGLETVTQCVAYIAENYQLERQIYRNRRALIHEKMPDRSLVLQSYVMAATDEMYAEADVVDGLLQWFSQRILSDEFVQETVMPLLSATFSSAWALWARLALAPRVPRWLIDRASMWKKAAESELEQVNELLDEHPEQIRGRLPRCLDYLEQELLHISGSKILVFSEHTETAERFYQAASFRMGAGRCAVFTRGMQPDALQSNAEAFQYNPNCSLLVCDTLGGEGRNFQMADAVVHIDTPWTPNALEQRIGRLDRLGRRPDRTVQSVVFYSTNTLEEQLVNLWDKGMGIYTASLSGLEIISNEITSRISQALKEDIRNGLFNTLPSIQAFTAEMKEAVRQEQRYDTAGMLYRPLNHIIEKMLDRYQGHEDSVFSNAMDSWASQAGFDGIPYHAGNECLIRYTTRGFHVNAAAKALFIPPDWGMYHRTEAQLETHGILGTYARETAITREDCHFFAPGDAIFDAVTRNAIMSYKGRVCATRLSGMGFEFKGLVFIWNIVPEIEALLQAGADPSLLAQFRAFLPLEQEITAHCVSGAEPPIEHIVSLLKDHYILIDGWHLGKRTGNGELYEFIKEYPPETWERFVLESRRRGLEQAGMAVKKKQNLAEAKELVSRIIAAVYASSRYFEQEGAEVTRTAKIYKAVIQSLSQSRLNLDAAAYLEVLP